ncbi:hypothetical protein K435DRAFT_874372 [Dendrothele bispora CBS 962.96]|uniref:DNase I-like protein n=1 Tax=Dendrothele bispora (strain CBS 962.96) TaxID=1314807 RepID=A0A4S8KWX0_DENBC|nr:hypothetical protein K435DRAFT_874372 [Dendrothele bispora CBS 962.96]
MDGERGREVEMAFSKRLKVFCSGHPTSPHTKEGVAIILNKEHLNVNNTEQTEIVPGRAMLIKMNWHNGRKLNICVVYAPNVNGSNGHENAEFWKTIHQYFEQNPSKKPDILAGDMNVVESGMVDRLPAHNDPEEATEALDNLKILTNLHDGWRDTYPDKKAYTFHQTATGSQS